MDEKAINQDLDNIIDVEEEILEGNLSKHVDDNQQTVYKKIQITDLQGNPRDIMDDVEIQMECINVPVDNNSEVEEVLQIDPSTCDPLLIEENNSRYNILECEKLKIELRKEKARIRSKKYREKLAQLKKMESSNVIHSQKTTRKEKLNRRKKGLRIASSKCDSVEIEEESGSNPEQKFDIPKYPSMVSTPMDNEKGVFALHDVDDGPVFVTWENKNEATDEREVMMDNSVQDSPRLKSLLTNGKTTSSYEFHNQIGRSNIQSGHNEKFSFPFQSTNNETLLTCEPTNFYQRKAIETNCEEVSDTDIYLELPNVMRLSDLLSEYICRFCTLTCNSKRSLIAHLIDHTGKNLLICPICRFLCLTPNALEMHMEVHNNKRRKC